MWEASKYEKPNLHETDYKERIKHWAKDEVGESCDSSDIENCRKRLCNRLNKENENVKRIITTVSMIFEKKGDKK